MLHFKDLKSHLHLHSDFKNVRFDIIGSLHAQQRLRIELKNGLLTSRNLTVALYAAFDLNRLIMVYWKHCSHIMILLYGKQQLGHSTSLFEFREEKKSRI